MPSKTRKFINYMFAGALSKHIAGERKLTDKERWGLIIMIWSLVYQVLKGMWTESKLLEREMDHETALNEQMRILREENRRLVAKNRTLSRANVELHRQLGNLSQA